MRTIIRNVRVLCMDDADTEYARANILIDDSKIQAIGQDLEFLTQQGEIREIDGTGKLAMPGLINGHFHSPVNLAKGSLDSLPLEIFMLYESPSLGDVAATAREAYVRTMMGALEMLKIGVTSLQDDAFFVPFPTPETIDGVMQAYEDSGIRATVALDQQNVVEHSKFPFLEDLLPEDIRETMELAPMLPASDLIALYQHLIERWHGRSEGRIRAGISCSAPQRVTVDYLQALDGFSETHGLPFYVHVLETKLQRVLGEEKFGKSLVRYLSDLGFLSERSNVIHAIWIDDDDIELLAKSGAKVAHNPVCNLRLGSGVMPFRKLRNNGVPICLGSDEAIADDSTNMWNVAKTVGLIHNITEPDYRNWPRAPEILYCLVRGGACAMLRDCDVGILAPGYQADLIMIDLDTLAFTPLNDLRRQLVYCENGSSVRLTMVAGRIVVEDGRVLTVDEESIKREAKEIVSAQTPAATSVKEHAEKMAPYYRQMYLKAAKRDVALNRWVGDAWRFE